ncbi:hypothetical protein FRC05_003316 [Tulasnella sp. 425]|nr:hypothetical protein FRC05_003316 [Tulasnella sp. 425]
MTQPHHQSTLSKELVDIEDAAVGAVTDPDHKTETDAAWEADPDNPRNWTSGKKWRMAGVISYYAFVSPVATALMAPALGAIAEGYHITNPTIIALTLGTFVLGYAFGPLVLAPLSEFYGRTWVLHVANLIALVFTIACAVAPSTGSLIAFRFLAGLGGAAPLAVGSGSIADLWDEKDRGAAMGLFVLGPVVGPAIGPVAGGFIAQNLNYHWVFWVLAILLGAGSVVGIPTLRETYAPVIRARKAKAQGRGLPNDDQTPEEQSLFRMLSVHLTRPFIILTTDIICLSLSLYAAVIYGTLYMMLVTLPDLYTNEYGWGTGISGLAYIGPGIGFIVGTAFFVKVGEIVSTKLAERHGGVRQPEYRIPTMLVGSLIMPVGLLWYGWCADQHAHWILPIIGGTIFGVGMMICFLAIQVYLVDSFIYAASAAAAATTLRSLFGFSFPLFADKTFSTLGIGGGYSLIAGLSVVLGWPFPIYIYLRGERLRARSKHTISTQRKQ